MMMVCETEKRCMKAEECVRRGKKVCMRAEEFLHKFW